MSTTIRTEWVIALLVGAVWVLSVDPARAQSMDTAVSPVIDAEAEDIYGEFMSPFCPGRLLKDCPSSQAHELKNEIRTRLTKGESRESIEQELLTLYGPEIQAAPAMEGFGISAWLTPLFFLVVGGAILAVWLRRNVTEES